MLGKNQVFLRDGSRMRYLGCENEHGEHWCIRIDDELAWPEPMLDSEVSSATCVRLAPAAVVTHSKAQLSKRDDANERLKPLLNSGHRLFDSTHRNRAIMEHAEEIGCSERTLHKDLRRYWQRGQSTNALLPDYHKSGRVTGILSGPSDVVSLTSGRGRKHEDGVPIYQITASDAQHMHQIIKTKYLKTSKCSVKDAHVDLIQEHYSYSDGNGNPYVNPPGAFPTLRQFRYFLLANYDVETRTRQRLGDSDFERDHRKVLGTVLADCQGVGHYYEIDATIGDIHLVSMEDVDCIIGKPTIYLIMDRKSRLIVGFYFGLENPSWTGAMLAILSISEDKRELCARYGVEYRASDWPAHEVFPREFLADRGDMISKPSDQIVEGLETTVTNLPSKRPDWKPLVESTFKQTHHSMRPVAPAYDPPSNFTKRRGKHYENEACLTVKDFGNIFLNTIIKQNRRAIAKYKLSTTELLAQVKPTPIELWQHGIVSRSGLLPHYQADQVRLALLRKGTATVTEHGVKFKGCYYSCQEALDQKWFEVARKSRFDVNVSYDVRLVNSIYVYPRKGNGAPYVARLTGEKYIGMCFEEVAFFEKLQKTTDKESEDSHLQNDLEYRVNTRPAIDSAKRRLKLEGSGKTRTARRADTKPARSRQKSIERQDTARIFSESQNHVSTPPKAPPDASMHPMYSSPERQLSNEVAQGAVGSLLAANRRRMLDRTAA